MPLGGDDPEGQATSEAQDNFDGQSSTADLADVLTKFVSSGSNSTFTCGGTIPLADFAAQLSGGTTALAPHVQGEVAAPERATYQATNVPSPIVLRWDRPDGSVSKVRFPVRSEDAKAFEDLVGDCQPAGFGHQGKNVHDENVRKAVAMDSSMFSTNICPYVMGIVDRVTQILLPNAAGVGPLGLGKGGVVRAEPYKLNIYRGPSGFFKSHVDTPRGETQFGSLVVSLPSAHKGGRLTVAHADLEPVAHGWDGSEGTESLQWAAFYSDCRHEVHEVTEGYRVTLTYNLYCESRNSYDSLSGLIDKPAPVDITKLAPYAQMKALLANSEWMKDGAVLGIFCAHAYPTNTSKVLDLDEYPKKRHPKKQPSSRSPVTDKILTLKGTDMSLYAVFKELGLEVRLAPIMTRASNLRSFTEWFPREGKRTKPGEVGLTGWVRDDDDDAQEIVKAFGDKLDNVSWITEPQWRDLALIHGNYFGNEVGPPGVAYASTALLVTVPDAVSRRGDEPQC